MGTVILYFKQSNIFYAHIYRFICRETRTLSPAEYLTVDCKTILETRKWASFYTKKEKIDRLKKALKQGKCPVTGMDLGEMFSISVFNRMGEQYLLWGKDWHSSHEDALVTSYYNDNLVLDMEHVIQTMEEDSVIAPIDTNQLSLEDSSHWAVNTRNDQERTRIAVGNPDWEHLDGVKIASKTWDMSSCFTKKKVAQR